MESLIWVLVGIITGGAIGGAVGAAYATSGVGRLLALKSDTLEALAAKERASVAESDALAARDGAVLRRQKAEAEHREVLRAVEDTRAVLEQVKRETHQLQQLASQEKRLQSSIAALTADQTRRQAAIAQLKRDEHEGSQRVRKIMSTVDLYSRIEEFVEFGHFDVPKYMYETSERYQVELRRIRDEQGTMIKAHQAVDLPEREDIAETKAATLRVLKSQAKLMLRTFNTECDYLIERVTPSSLSRTLQQIEKVAEQIDKLAASLHCGLNARYVELKYRECAIFYEFRLRKDEEQQEQRAMREQMREEAKARAEAERGQQDAEKQEALYEKLLKRAREEANHAASAERAAAMEKVRQLELQLQAAVAEKERAKSMAEQTRRGYVYIISNIGSFGHDVYKIGLTRRLDPQDRIDELGDASVPFSFDVHALIFHEDAPKLENELHRAFHHRRVNAVNLRKEFFRITLQEIRAKAEQIAGSELDFKTTIAAEEYYESRRLQDRASPNVVQA